MIKNLQRKNFENQLIVEKLSPVISWIVIFVLIFASLRGWAVLNLNLPSQYVYNLSGISVLALSFFGIFNINKISHYEVKFLKKIFFINFTFGFFLLTGNFLLSGNINPSSLYPYLVPFTLFIFLLIDVSKIKITLLLITIGISFSIFSDYYTSLSCGGYCDALSDQYKKLRPLTFNALSYNGPTIRLAGYTGSFHDSANILGMLSVYYFFESIVKQSSALSLIAIFSTTALLRTQSATNIALSLFCCIFFISFIFIQKNSHIFLLFICSLLVMFGFIFMGLFSDELFAFIAKISSSTELEMMLNHTNFEMFFSPSFWTGFGYFFGIDHIKTEIAFLKDIFEKGIIPACFLFYILIYPFFVFLRTKALKLIPCLASISFAFISLLHYGSLFRVTNFVLFFTFYSLFFIYAINIKPINDSRT